MPNFHNIFEYKSSTFDEGNGTTQFNDVTFLRDFGETHEYAAGSKWSAVCIYVQINAWDDDDSDRDTEDSAYL
jgi:hypothetical protein